MDDIPRTVKNMHTYAISGNYHKLKVLFDKNNFNQKDIDEAFRLCIHFYNKNQNETFINCLKLFLKNTTDINYRNAKFEDTTILMYSIDESKEAATDLIISCFKDELDINLPDIKGDNTIFHLINNDNFSQKTKIDFITDLGLKDFNLFSINKKKKTIKDILIAKENLKLFDEIENIINEVKFNQNKLTDLYNKDKFYEVYELLGEYEKNKNNKEIVNKHSFNFNKKFMELKIILKTLDANNKGKPDPKKNTIKMLLEDKGIDDLTLELMRILKKVSFDGGGEGNCNEFENNKNDNSNKSNISYSLCLIINKMIMFYQLDYYIDFVQLNNKINSFSIKGMFFHLYKNFINIDMMIQRGLYLEANDELNNLKEIINNYELKKKNNKNSKKKDMLIIPKDLIFDNNNLQNLLKLYQIFINSFLKKQSELNVELEIDELKSIKIEENKQENEQTDNNTIKNFQKYLFLRLNYLESGQNKISYKMNDPYGILDIKGINTENELNKIYYYQYLGIISLKNQKYSISTYFFLKCFQLIAKKSKIQLIKRNHFYPVILYNLSLAYFYSKKYKETIKCLYMLLNYSYNKSKFFVNYKYIYYRLGLSNLEILMQENNTINALYDSYMNNKFILKTPKLSSFYEKIDIIEYFKKTFILIKNNPKDPLYFSTLINLVFCLIIKENYLEAIFYLKMNKLTDINQINITRTYLFQCYIYINKINLAKKISEEMILDSRWLKGGSKSDLKFYEKLNSRLIETKGIKISVLVNMIKLCIETKKINELQKYLMSILDSISLDISFCEQGKINVNEEIPTYIINVFVYYYLMINRKDLALDILKKRKIKEIIISNKLNI